MVMDKSHRTFEMVLRNQEGATVLKTESIGEIMDKEQFIHDALCLPTQAIDYHVSLHLSTLFPERALLQGSEGLFNIEEFARAGYCHLEHKAVVYNQVITHWRAPEISNQPWRQSVLRLGGHVVPGPTEAEQQIFERSNNAWLEVAWGDSHFDVIIMHWPEGPYQVHYHYWILAESMERARDLLIEVCKWNAEIRGEVLVFEGGCWHKDAQLFQAIKNSTFDNLILRGSLKQEIGEDLEQFFTARDTYETYNIPWKRGILFVGPPGNGKTHAVKAIINSMNQPCLYVKSFHVEHRPDEDSIRAVFDRARKAAPCILVLEDLDSLLTPQNRSFFLNELDGFAANIGIVTLATTNHPERLDPSILDRPSRFDRKYPFELPEQPERQEYIAMWNTSLQETLRISDATVIRLSEATEGFSFAYLKELFLSSMMRWIAHPQQGTMEQTLISQVDVLREQMLSPVTLAAEAESEEASKNAISPVGRVISRRVV
jgi:hypothetical protein